jgi:hypothetical protein
MGSEVVIMKYANRFFKDFHKRNSIWRKFMNKDDIYNGIERVKGSVAYMSEHPPHKLNGEDMDFMLEPLAELELGLSKVEQMPNSFDFSEEELKEIKESYVKLKEKIEKINMQRLSW